MSLMCAFVILGTHFFINIMSRRRKERSGSLIFAVPCEKADHIKLEFFLIVVIN